MEGTNKIRNKNFMYELDLVLCSMYEPIFRLCEYIYYLAILLLAIMITDLKFKAN